MIRVCFMIYAGYYTSSSLKTAEKRPFLIVRKTYANRSKVATSNLVFDVQKDSDRFEYSTKR